MMRETTIINIQTYLIPSYILETTFSYHDDNNNDTEQENLKLYKMAKFMYTTSFC